MLVIVEYRNLHPAAQLLLDVKAFRRLDVFEIDAAEGGLQTGDDLHELVRIALVDLDVEYVDAGKFLEQYALAFHNRFAREGANRSEPQYGRAVGDYADQVAAGRVTARGRRIAHD